MREKTLERQKVLWGTGGEGKMVPEAMIKRQDNITGDGEKTRRGRAGDVSEGWEGLWMLVT